MLVSVAVVMTVVVGADMDVMVLAMAVVMTAAAVRPMIVMIVRVVVVPVPAYRHHVAHRSSVRMAVVVALMRMGVLMLMRVLMLMVVMMIVVVVMVVMVVMATAARLAMCVVVAMRMLVPVIVAVSGGGLVGAAFRLERRLDEGDAGAETARHLLQHRVSGDADAIGQKLRGDVTVAEMPGQAGEMMGIPRHDLGHRLLGRHHGDDPAVVKPDAVAVLQPHRLGQVEQEGDIPLSAHRDTAAVAAIMGQHHAIGRGSEVPGAGGQQRAGVDHGVSPAPVFPAAKD